ncbi:MAG: hypothetical protein RQ801_03325 [Spirochaetaceae bacterium]|nr:hypothetical protein [Spirochaetaceae bacterium]MDT8297308.1 hypothetical protein [Spirochaetaceae bacterium]
MIDLTKYEQKNECSDLVDEIRKLRDVATKFAEAAELMSVSSEPIHPGVVECSDLCRKKAHEALEAFRKI